MTQRRRRWIARTLSASLLFGTAPLVPRPALAQLAAPAADAKAEASDRFDRGLRLFNDGDNAGALAEFKRAYALIPNPLALFNIGLVYATMGRPVEAVAALDQLLASPGSLSAERLARAKQTRDEQAPRIAELTIVTSVPARVDVDGIVVGQTPLAAPIKVAGGLHVVGAVVSGYAPTRKEITIAGGQKAEVTLDLIQMQGNAAQVTVKTHLPGADVLIDDQVVGKTPLPQSVSVAPGRRTVALRRAGYRSARQELTLGDGATAEVALELEEDDAALTTAGGFLALDATETQPVVTIDGRSRGVYVGGFRLAMGVHRLLVERGGFASIERDVTIDAGRTTTVHLVLEPTPDTRAAYVSRTTTQRTWGLVLVIGGVAIAGGAVGFTVWNAAQKSDAQAALDSANADIANKRTPACDNRQTTFDQVACRQPALVAQTNLSNASNRQPFGYVGMGVGAAAAAVGLYLLIANDSPHRYDPKGASDAAARRWLPLGWSDAHGGGLGIVGAF